METTTRCPVFPVALGGSPQRRHPEAERVTDLLRDTGLDGAESKVRRSAQDDDFVGVLTKNIPNRLALMGLTSWAKFKPKV